MVLRIYTQRNGRFTWMLKGRSIRDRPNFGFVFCPENDDFFVVSVSFVLAEIAFFSFVFFIVGPKSVIFRRKLAVERS